MFFLLWNLRGNEMRKELKKYDDKNYIVKIIPGYECNLRTIICSSQMSDNPSEPTDNNSLMETANTKIKDRRSRDIRFVPIY